MNRLCEICGKRMASETHHLIYGKGIRNLCDDDSIILELCQECHKEIHYNANAGHLSKMLGQALWERFYLGDFGDAKESLQKARENFMERYGRSWL